MLSPYFYTIVEVKNIMGTLYFDPVFNQLIRKKTYGYEVGFPDPTFQVKRQQSQFFKWLKQYNLPTAPVRYLIGIGDSKTILKTSINNHYISKWIVHKWAAAFKIESF
ncbi:nuclease-related domain-containing protein [Pseudalkalibacillus sp. A8]|uniref:nuclease-related domain-containing protein n=1 Tax=Pseudalkalibacillus sp. A8 TaxID=3382641 RepID=UPI0038B47B2E